VPAATGPIAVSIVLMSLACTYSPASSLAINSPMLDFVVAGFSFGMLEDICLLFHQQSGVLSFLIIIIFYCMKILKYP
jgi:hypothetical protein